MDHLPFKAFNKELDCYAKNIMFRETLHSPENILVGNNIISWVHDIAYAMLRSFIVEN